MTRVFRAASDQAFVFSFLLFATCALFIIAAGMASRAVYCECSHISYDEWHPLTTCLLPQTCNSTRTCISSEAQRQNRGVDLVRMTRKAPSLRTSTAAILRSSLVGMVGVVS